MESAKAALGPLLSIGALSRAAGIPVQTLRTWESRYGFPDAVRRPSGHRVYPVAVVARLRRVAEAIARGHRAGQVVAASDDELAALLQVAPQRSPDAPPDDGVDGLLRAVIAFDSESLQRLLLPDWARLGPVAFLTRRIGPLVVAVGAAWEDGRLDVGHEHFLTERVGDLLRSLRLPFEDRASGPVIVLATLPGETHGLGVQMAALVLAAAGLQVLSLGTEVPTPQIAQVCKDVRARGARAVGLVVDRRGGDRRQAAPAAPGAAAPSDHDRRRVRRLRGRRRCRGRTGPPGARRARPRDPGRLLTRRADSQSRMSAISGSHTWCAIGYSCHAASRPAAYAWCAARPRASGTIGSCVPCAKSIGVAALAGDASASRVAGSTS